MRPTTSRVERTTPARVDFPAVQARVVLKALNAIGWEERRCKGSHTILARGGQIYVFAFHSKEEVGPRMLGRIAKQTGLTAADVLSAR